LEETEESARKILEGAGFVPIVVGDAEGTVFRQQPSPGERRPPGTEVSLWFEPAVPNPPTPQRTSTPTPTPPAGGPSAPKETSTPEEISTADENSTSGEMSTSSTTASPTGTASPSKTTATSVESTMETSEASVLLIATNWRGIGLTAAVVALVAAGAFVAGRAISGRWHGKRWAADHLRVSGRSDGTATTTQEGAGQSIRVVGSRREPTYTLKERPE